MVSYIWIRGIKYYYYGTYRTWEEAYRLAKYYHKKNKKCKYFIIKKENGLIMPYFSYKLYLTKVIVMGVFR